MSNQPASGMKSPETKPMFNKYHDKLFKKKEKMTNIEKKSLWEMMQFYFNSPAY